MKLVISAILLIVLMSGTVCARLPQVGDHVAIACGEYDHSGIITDITDTLICIQNSGIQNANKTRVKWDSCFGIGAIKNLVWLDDDRKMEKQYIYEAKNASA